MIDQLDPRRTAVVNVHWQHEVVSPDGVFGPAFAESVERHGVIAKAAELNAAMRETGGLVVYLRTAFRPGYPDMFMNTPAYRLIAERGAYIEGTPATRIVDELKPEPGDVVITHLRLNGFRNSELDDILRIRAVDTVLLVGVATNIAVESTARGAVDHGYRTVLVSDACAAASDEMHRASLATLESFGPAGTTAEVVRALRAVRG
ncbi:MAG TPA: cysteine hydrolase [Micromonospora sp.]